MGVIKEARAYAKKTLKEELITEPILLSCDRFLTVTDKVTAKQSKDLDIIQSYIASFPEPKGRPGVFPVLGYQKMMTVYAFGYLLGMRGIAKRSSFTLPRKQGKTSYLAKVAMASMKFCPDMDPKVFSFATQKDQANLVLNDAMSITRQYHKMQGYEPGPKSTYGDWRNLQYSLVHLPNSAIWEAKPSESKTLDGLFWNLAIFDEASLVDDSVYDVVKTAESEAASWQHMIAISTASENTDGWFGRRIQEDLNRMRGGRDTVTNLLAWMPDMSPQGECLLTDDQEKDPKVWSILCPGMGTCTSVQQYQEEYDEASMINSERVSFRIKRLNVWGESERPGLMTPSEARRICNMENNGLCDSSFKKYPCVIGVDVADNYDMTSLSLVCQDEHNNILGKTVNFMCKQSFDARSKRDSERILRTFNGSSLLIITGDKYIDYDAIYRQITDWCLDYNIVCVIADRMESGRSLFNFMERRLPVVYREFSPSKSNKSLVTNYFMDAVTERRAFFKDNQLFRWEISNAALDYYLSEEGGKGGKTIVRKSRKRSSGIDGIYAVLHALYYYAQNYTPSVLPRSKEEYRQTLGKLFS